MESEAEILNAAVKVGNSFFGSKQTTKKSENSPKIVSKESVDKPALTTSINEALADKDSSRTKLLALRDASKDVHQQIALEKGYLARP